MSWVSDLLELHLAALIRLQHGRTLVTVPEKSNPAPRLILFGSGRVDHRPKRSRPTEAPTRRLRVTAGKHVACHFAAATL